MIVSLVRNNKDGHIGFVGVENRINVMLSRAKEGMYILGNVQSLEACEKTTMWKDVLKMMREEDCVGTELEVILYQTTLETLFLVAMSNTSRSKNEDLKLDRISTLCRRWRLQSPMCSAASVRSHMPKVKTASKERLSFNASDVVTSSAKIIKQTTALFK